MQGTPEPPDELDDKAKEVWRAYAPIYEVQVRDIPYFWQFCVAFARWKDLTELNGETDAVIVRVAGKPVTNPNLVRADREFQNYSKALQLMLKSRGRKEAPPDESIPLTLEQRRARLLDRIGTAGDDSGTIGGHREAAAGIPTPSARND